jgi:putative zinc finger/helix-turn-helix YgiT family protein
MNIKKKDICPNCEKVTDIELVKTTESVKVRGEEIKVDVEYSKCLVCGGEFTPPQTGADSVAEAYREYRKRHSMLQPEEIRTQREKYGLTQQEMSRLLGWGGVTLSRYENGALQDAAHEKALRRAVEPHNLLKMLEETPNAINAPEKRERLMKELKALDEENRSFENIYEERFGHYCPDEFSGYKKLDIEKFINAILFFCKEGILKTKLNKLLFYADFKHYKDYSVSITGMRYARYPYGPVPDKYDYYFATLVDENAVSVSEEFYPNGYSGEQLISVKQTDLSMFTTSELKMLASVKEYFKDMTSTKISEFSHQEKGYIETPERQFISYAYADDLRY